MIGTLPEVEFNVIQQIFDAQKANQYIIAESSVKDRISKLKKLYQTILKYRPEIRDALYKDYRRPAAEVDLGEIYPITSKIKHTINNLYTWMAPQRVSTPLALLGSKSWIHYEPKGVCLIISPWNYPIQLALGPLISAVAAGNTVIIKPSESTPFSSAILRMMVEEVFEQNEVAVVEGAVDVATALLDLRFNHIFFTGAPEVGKIVMAAAAKNLASVTLELGGKSPTIIDETANLNIAASRIAWAKFSNCGQICIAPDYVIIHESRLDEFIIAIKSRIKEYYGESAADSNSYMRIVNNRHFQRVKSYLDDSVRAGAKVVHGGLSDSSQNYLEPTVVTNLPKDCALMEQEIFGPILPVISYSDLNEVINLIRSKENPLGLYIYSKSNKNIDQIIRSTRAGGTCINSNAIHFFNPNLPFGGSGHSGLGKTHGRFGFIGFSNERAIYKQTLPSALDKLSPPYDVFKMKLIDWTIKWF